MPESKKSKPIQTSSEIKARARELRKQAIPAEKVLWEQLRNRRLKGIKFRRQHPLGTYIVDFYCPAHRLVVEIDGEFHRYQADQDQARTQEFEDYGFRVIRFWNHEVEQNLDAVLNSISKACDLPSPKAGRRGGDEGSQ